MTEKKTLQYAENAVLLGIWLLAIFAPVLSMNENNNSFWHELKISFGGMLPFFLLFVVNHFLLIPKFLFCGRGVWFSVLNVVLVALIYIFFGVFDNKPRHMELKDNFPPYIHENDDFKHDGPPPHKKPLGPPFKAATLILSILVIGCDCGVKLGFRYIKIMHENTQKEKQDTENKLVLLKRQVSPHFFMNTLNNIHALIDIDPELAKEAVIRLSKLMRYMLYDCQKVFSELGKEVEFISSYVSLMRLRYSQKVKIELDIAENLPQNKEIPSLIFISMIENAFKHGISYVKPSFIEIKISVSKDFSRLFFSSRNSIPDKSEVQKTGTKTGGIGLKNTVSQLDLIYGKNYVMDIIRENDVFEVKLEIPL